MLRLEEFEKIWLWRPPVDFRKQMSGLVLLVENELMLSPFDKVLFVFSNRARDRIRILYWRGSGFAMWSMILEKEIFRWPSIGDSKLMLTPDLLRWLLAGYDISRMRPHRMLSYSRVS